MNEKRPYIQGVPRYACPLCGETFKFSHLEGPRVPAHVRERVNCPGSGEVPIRAVKEKS